MYLNDYLSLNALLSTILICILIIFIHGTFTDVKNPVKNIFAPIVSITYVSIPLILLADLVGINIPTLKFGTGSNRVKLSANAQGKLRQIRTVGGVAQAEESISSEASIVVSDTAPTSPSDGDTWFDTTDATLNVYYNR